MAKIWTMGEILCEIMRPNVDMPLGQAGVFLGPYPSGAPANFIDTVARLGHSAGIIGGVGKDNFGELVLKRLKSSGVDCTHITQYEDGSTGVAFVTYFSDGSRRFIFHFPDTPATRPLAPPPQQLGSGIRLFHIMGCSLMAKPSFGQEIVKLMRQLAAQGVQISFDPNIRPELMQDSHGLVETVMAHCNMLLPGRAELLSITGKPTAAEAVAKCFEWPQLEVIALKEGEKGVTVYTRSEQFSLGVIPVPVKDPTGAGDAFDAAFVCGILEGRSLREAAKMATAAAALTTAAFGPMEGDISAEIVEKMKEDVPCYN